MDLIVDWLIRRAKRTPYWHLIGYMERYWLVPYNKVIERKISCRWTDTALDGTTSSCTVVTAVTDGTGPVSPWRRPFARLVQSLGIAARVHHILRSDSGRDPHDHPWWFVTIVLRGGYYEHRYDAFGSWVSRRWHGPGSVLIRAPEDLHMLELPKGKTAWTLFITGPKKQTWGFKPEGMPKIPYHLYEKG